MYIAVIQMETYGRKFSDHKIVEKVLRSLPSKFGHVDIIVEESKGLYAYSRSEHMGSLLGHEERMNWFAGKKTKHSF